MALRVFVALLSGRRAELRGDKESTIEELRRAAQELGSNEGCSDCHTTPTESRLQGFGIVKRAVRKVVLVRIA